MFGDTSRLTLDALDYRRRIERLCRERRKSGEAPLLPNALGYVLVQIKERLVDVESLKLPVVLELVQLLDVAQEVQRVHGDSRRVREIVRLVSESFREGSNQYRRLMQNGVLESDTHQLLNEAGAQIIASVRWLRAHDKGGA